MKLTELISDVTESKTLFLSLSENAADEMCFKLGSNPWTSWEPYATEKNIDPWNFSRYYIFPRSFYLILLLLFISF